MFEHQSSSRLQSALLSLQTGKKKDAIVVHLIYRPPKKPPHCRVSAVDVYACMWPDTATLVSMSWRRYNQLQNSWRESYQSLPEILHSMWHPAKTTTVKEIKHTPINIDAHPSFVGLVSYFQSPMLNSTIMSPISRWVMKDFIGVHTKKTRLTTLGNGCVKPRHSQSRIHRSTLSNWTWVRMWEKGLVEHFFHNVTKMTTKAGFLVSAAHSVKEARLWQNQRWSGG